jgi:hypothetical protein
MNYPTDAEKILLHLKLANTNGVQIYGAHHAYHMGMIWDLILTGMGWNLERSELGKYMS